MPAEKSAPMQRGRPFPKGRSGNPKGKPKGARNKSTLAAQALLDGEAEALTRRCIDLALEGDTTALRLCIDRICPPSRSRPVRLDLPKLDGAMSITEAHVRVVEALAAGELDPDTATTVIGVLARTRETYELTTIEARLAALEAKQETRK